MAGKNNSEDARIRNKESAARRADMWVKEANSKLNELSRLFLTLVTLVFTLSLPIISNPNSLDSVSKVLLILSWISSLTSLGFGIYSIWMDAKFFENLKNIDNNSERIWSQRGGDYDEMFEEDQKNRSGMPQSTSFVPLAIQLTFLTISLLLLTTIGVRLLFYSNHSEQTGHRSQYCRHTPCRTTLKGLRGIKQYYEAPQIFSP